MKNDFRLLIKIINKLFAYFYDYFTECGTCRVNAKKLTQNKFCKRDYGKENGKLLDKKPQIMNEGEN